MHSAMLIARRLPVRTAALNSGRPLTAAAAAALMAAPCMTTTRRSPAALATTTSTHVLGSRMMSSSSAVEEPRVATAAGAATPPPLSVRDHLTATLRHLLAFKSQLPTDLHARLSSAVASGGYATSSPLKVLVVADRHVGRGALVNTLLQYPEGKAIINETWGTEVHDVITLTKGETFKEERIEEPAAAAVRNIQVPSPALDGTEWTIVPPLSTNWPHLHSYLTTHDLILFITDTPRHLSTPLESSLAQTLSASGQPFVVVVNGTDYLAQPSSELPLILATIRARIGASPPVFPTSTRRASLAQYLGTPTTPQDDAASGVPALAHALHALSADARQRTQVQRLATLAAAARALDHLDAQLHAAHSTLDALDARFESAVTAKIVKEQDRLLSDFHARDLRKVHAAVARVAANVRGFFDGVPFWRLFWTADGVAADLKAHLRAHVLSEAESRMATAAGRLGEGLRYVWLDLDKALADMRADVAAPAAHEEPVAASMTGLLDRLAHVCQQDAETLAHVDSFALSNVVWRYRAQYEAGDHAQHVRATAEHLVLRTGSLVALAWVAALTGMANHVVDPSLGVAAGLGASAVALEAMRRGWASFEDGYLQTIAGVEDGLNKDLVDEYHRLVHDKLTVPMSNLVDMYELASKEQRRQVDEVRVKLEQLRKEVDDVRERVTRGD